MKKLLWGLLLIAFSCGWINSATASLIFDSSRPEILYDDTNEQYWIRDLRIFMGIDFSAKLTLINDYNTNNTISIADAGLWRMANLSDMKNLWTYSMSDIINSFLPSYPSSAGNEWQGFYNEQYSSDSHYWAGIVIGGKTNLQYQYYLDTYTTTGAWVVADRINPVPEPATMILLGLGLLGLVGITRKQR